MRLLEIQRFWLIALLIWLGGIALGYAWLFRYSFAAGKAMTAPLAIPASLAPAEPLTRAHLFIALHPRCPCSRATVRELAKILSHSAGATEVTVLMYKPAGASDTWLEGALLDECRRMKCRIRPDPDGRLAASVGSLTSGGVALYGGDGKLRYQGGITASRGHEGDNVGENAVIEILRGNGGSHRSMPVFGCPIQKDAKQ